MEVERKLESKNKRLRKPSLKELLKAIQEVTGVTENEIVSRRRSKEALLARGILVRIWREYGYRLVDLQPTLERDLSVLSRWSRISDRANYQEEENEVLGILNARMQA